MKIRNVEIETSFEHPGQEAFWKTVQDNKWEPETFDVLDKYIVPGQTFIDIGAWNGVLSLYASKLTCQASCEWYLEFKMLSENCRINGSYDIQAWEMAISDVNGKVILESHNGDWGNSMSTIVDRHEQKGQKEVKAVSLSEFINLAEVDMGDVCLIKIDTEGGETLIVPSSRELLKKYQPTILLSLHSFWFPDYERNCAEIADTIFPIYRVYPVYAYQEKNLIEEHTPETFKAEMDLKRCTDVLLIAK